MQKTRSAAMAVVSRLAGKGTLVVLALFFVFLAGVSSIYIYAGGRVAHAAAASTMNFQARVLQANGAVVADGSYSVEFKLYDAAAAGTNEWTETQNLVAKNGYITASLGSVTPFPGTIDWSQEHWLTLNVNGDGEMGPTRMKLTAVPYSFRSGQADTLTNGSGTITAAGLLQLSAAAPQTTNSSNAAIRVDQQGLGGLLQLQAGGTDRVTVANNGDIMTTGGIIIGNNTGTTAGTIRWTGSDFEGYNGAGWVSLTAGGGASATSTTAVTLTSSVTNLAATTTVQAGLLNFTNTTAVSNIAGTNTGFVAPANGSFRSCVVNNGAAITGGTVTVRWRVNGATVGAAACVMNTTNPRYGASTIDAGVATFNAGDTVNIALESNGLTPAGSLEFTAYWTVEFDGSASDAFVQGGNAFAATAVLGTTDSNALNLITNGTTRLSISNTGLVTVSDSLAVNGSATFLSGIDLNNAGITNTGVIGGVTTISASSGLTLQASADSFIELNGATNQLLTIRNTDALAVVAVNIEGGVTAASFVGAGSGITLLNAGNISSGTLDNNRLSANVGLIDTAQTYTARPTFSSGIIIGNTAATTAGTIRWTGSDFEGYEGSAWVSLTSGGGGGGTSDSTTTIKPADEIITSATVLQDDDHLYFAIGANENWAFKFVVQANSPVAADLQFAVTAPSGAICDVSVVDAQGAMSAANLGCGASSGLVAVAVGDHLYEITGTVRNGSTAGNVRLQWAQNTSDIGNTTVYSGSFVQATPEGSIVAPPNNAFVQGGNSFGGTAIIGTADSQELRFITSGTRAFTLYSNGEANFTYNAGFNNTNADNKIGVNVATTADSAAQVLVSTDGINNKGLVLQTVSGQIANVLEAQNNNGAVLLAVDKDGQLMLGNDNVSPQAGMIAFNDSTGNNAFTAVLGSNTLSANRTISLPDASGTICLSNSTGCGFVAFAGSSAQGDSSTNSSIFIDKTGASGDLLTLQKNGTTVLSVLNSGALQLQLTSTAAFTVNSAGGTQFFNVDTSGALVRIGGATADANATLFILDTKNTTGDPTGADGGSYYNSADAKSRCYEDGYWTDCTTSAVVGETTLDAANATINVTLAKAYESLECRIESKGRSLAGTINLRFNNVATAATYGWNTYYINGTAVADAQSASDTEIQLSSTVTATTPFSADVKITNFSDTNKAVDWTGVGVMAIGTNMHRFSGGGMMNLSSGSITSVQFLSSAGTFNAGSHAWCEGRNVR